ncbi:lysoplasmalogenase [Aquimarina sp. AU474]|uniref:lysoplasmalogenase n=1 Tax=Aquimarina sp. AU474 TaxID=2108529 RepID=UPI000D68648F|nr:lysoplasmalogenase [Aquimarina sp. AU474]
MGEKILDKKSIIFIIIYAIILLCDLICSSTPSFLDLRLYTKPAIISSLIIFFLGYKRKLPVSVFWMMIMALVFSLFGDILLLFTNKSQLFFIMGLVMFLFAHVMYIIVFFKNRDNQNKGWYFTIFTIAYGFGLFYILYPGLGEMLIPVIVYMLIILLMSNASFMRSKNVSKISYVLVFIGSLFFMLSDSLLAINMFYKKIPLAHIWVMTTYATAQLLIVYGILTQKEPVIQEK